MQALGGAVIAVIALIWTPTAVAEQVTASQGSVSAAFSFTKGSSDEPYTGLTLTIARAGQVAFQGPGATKDCAEPYCYPSFGGEKSLRIADLTGDGEPEVLLGLFTGGAHCCSITRFFQWNGTTYSSFDHNFLHSGFRRADINGDRVVELVSDDSGFAYAFSSYAESLRPIQIWNIGAGRLSDVTGGFRDRIRKDGERAYKLYLQHRTRGAITAWAADRYRLGHRKSALRRLRRLAAAHKLPARGFPPKSQRSFVLALDRFLRKAGYG